jgi:hypothetical protein
MCRSSRISDRIYESPSTYDDYIGVPTDFFPMKKIVETLENYRSIFAVLSPSNFKDARS